jgi:SAM-dependent methyltransferase
MVTDRPGWAPEDVDNTAPSAARMYDYMLGGGHNFAVDRELVDRINVVSPVVSRVARFNRAFLRRAVLTLVDSGIRQFLDIGSGIPTVGNVHEIAQRADPQASVVYVDNDPVAVAYSEQVLARNDRATAIMADMRDPQSVLGHSETTRTLDFDAPIGLLMVTVFHYVADSDDPMRILGEYRDALATGSHLALTHVTSDADIVDSAEVAAIVDLMSKSPNPIYPRSREAIAELFTGFDLLDPGLVRTVDWRPNGETGGDLLLAGVGVKR